VQSSYFFNLYHCQKFGYIYCLNNRQHLTKNIDNVDNKIVFIYGNYTHLLLLNKSKVIKKLTNNKKPVWRSGKSHLLEWGLWGSIIFKYIKHK
jgi:hypothetical protein